MDQRLIDHLDAALNEAEVSAIRYDSPRDEARLYIEVQALPEVGPIDPDPRRIVAMSGGRSLGPRTSACGYRDADVR